MFYGFVVCLLIRFCVGFVFDFGFVVALVDRVYFVFRCYLFAYCFEIFYLVVLLRLLFDLYCCLVVYLFAEVVFVGCLHCVTWFFLLIFPDVEWFWCLWMFGFDYFFAFIFGDCLFIVGCCLGVGCVFVICVVLLFVD